MAKTDGKILIYGILYEIQHAMCAGMTNNSTFC